MNMSKCGLAALLMMAAGSASAFPGPDVIVGDLPDVSHWGNQTVSGVVIEAYSVGTTSCNVGDVPLNWISNTNQHPVISGNMYRLDPATSRFQQIGQSWLKHGFTALQGTVCYTDCQAHPNGTRLGVHCSDPYGSGLNGNQSGLGPKFEVNASTGHFTYPFTAGSGSGAIFKRLQVRRTDLQTPNALYFVSSQYIAPDDAVSGNGNNNESYRRITVNTGNYDIALQGATQRMRSSIYAWKDHGLGVNQPDPNVFITSTDVPSDGRFLVGAKAIDVGGGRWRYEFAVENLSSHASGASFSVPIPAANMAGVTNIGFSDVDYHSGEPFSGVNWTSSVSNGAVTFACTQTFAQNPNANALRWGTMYNFWFECDLPPAGGQATIGTFRPGVSPTVNASTVVPSPDGQPHPLNDSCENAAQTGSGASAFTTVGASTDGPLACADFGFPQISNDIWYRWSNGACAGDATVATCGSAFDTKIAVYPDAGCPADNTQIACNDDNTAACGANSVQSSLTFAAAANTSYLIRVGGYNGASGAGTLTITDPYCAPPPGPINDDCANAIYLTDGVVASGTTVNSNNDGTANCGAAGSSPDVWYRYVPTTSAQVRIDTCGSPFDTVVSVHTGDCGSLNQVACNDDNGGQGPCPGGLTSYVTFNGVAGTNYYIRVTGYNNAIGTFNVRAQGGGGIAPPANNDCANRSGVSLGNTNFTTAGATTDGPAHNACTFSGNDQVTNDIWFNYPSQCDGTLTIETCAAATSFNTKLAVYSGDACTNFESRLLGCSDDSCGTRSRIEIPVASGQHYTIRVGGFNGATGTGVLSLTCTTAPVCDPDVNCDGVPDQDDVACIILAVAGDMSCFCQTDPDFNGDGVPDQGDVADVILVVAGAPCP